MVGATLHHDVAALEMHLLAVEHQPDFAFGDDAVVQRFGAVHQFVLRIGLAGAGMRFADFGKGGGGILGTDLVLHAVRRDIHHADDAAQRAWAQLQRLAGRVVSIVQRRGAGWTVPHLVEHRAGHRLEREVVGGWATQGDHCLSGRIVAGHHTFEVRKCLHRLFLD